MGSGYASKDEIREMFGKDRDMSKVNRIAPLEQSFDEDGGPPKKVGVYCRVSTDGISQTVSFELQKKYYIKYVKNHAGWILKCLYSDEGISATSVKRRDGLLRMMEDARAGIIDLVVVKNISRLSRNLKDSLRIISELKSLPKPVGIYFESEHLNTLDPAMELIIRVLSILAEEESKKKSEAITASVRQRFEEGYYLVQPVLGYKRTGVNKIDIDEAEAETVRLIYDMYLAGYGAKRIAEILIELGLRKHTHRYLDGRIKEGGTDWTGASVLNVLSNEKRCGDVNAQKTYTFDCIDHIVRKNKRNVPQYYARDQHPAIISREEFYLGLKMKESNKGGWDRGIPVLRTYTSGTLRGYVRVVPGWYGFGMADYMLAALKANGIDFDDISIYPDYVFSPDIDSSFAGEEREIFRYYEVSETEFNTDPVITPEEYELLKEEEPHYLRAFNELKELQEKTAGQKKLGGKAAATAWMFSRNDKPVATFDRNGISFNRHCRERLKRYNSEYCDLVEILYNPVTEKILVIPAEEPVDEKYAMRWCKSSEDTVKMLRCSARGFAGALFEAMGWNRSNKYEIVGSRREYDNTTGLEFDLKYTIVKAYLRSEKKAKEKADVSGESNRLELIKEEARNTGAYYSDSDDLEMYVSYITGKVESKSRAVYFETENIQADKPVSLADYGDEKYDPAFIKALLEKEVTPLEGWDYLKGKVTWTPYGFQIPSAAYLQRQDPMRRSADYFVSDPAYNSADRTSGAAAGDTESEQSLLHPDMHPPVPGPSKTADFGWTTGFSFPTEADVMKRINNIRRRNGTSQDYL